MNKISELEALEELKNKIDLCSAKVTQQDTIKPFSTAMSSEQAAKFDLIFPGSSIIVAAAKAVAPAVRKEFRSPKKWNQIFNPLWEKHGVAEEIEITPQLARFLADDYTVHAVKKAVVDKEDQKKWGQEAKIAGIGAFAAFTGEALSSGVAISNAVDRVKTYMASKKAYARILQERDQIARHILSTYLVTEPEPGRYVLKRGAWTSVPKLPESALVVVATKSLTDFALEIQPVGFDPKIDLSKLPELSPLKDGPAK